MGWEKKNFFFFRIFLFFFSNCSSNQIYPDSNQYSLKPFDARLCKKLFRHQHDQRKFVLSALTHQNEGDVARLLASDDGRERVRELLSTSYTLNAGDSSQRFSFQRVAVPLCSMMSHVVRASCSSDGKALLNVFDRNETFVDDYIDHVRQLVARPNLLHDDGHRADKTSFEVASVLDTIEPLVGILLETLTTLTNSRADAKWTGVVETLREAVDELYEDSKQWKTTCGNVQRCWNLLKSVREQQEAEARALAAQQLHQDQVMAERLQIGVDIPLENEPLPGELRDDGPRHDNDKKLFRAIRVLPTREEVVSPIKPYLPRQKHPENASPFIAESVDRHLDVQFRLMREDMLAPVRRGVRAFVEQRPLCRLRRDEVSFTFNDESRSGDRVICSLYRNTTVTGKSCVLFLKKYIFIFYFIYLRLFFFFKRFHSRHEIGFVRQHQVRSTSVAQNSETIGAQSVLGERPRQPRATVRLASRVGVQRAVRPEIRRSKTHSTQQKHSRKQWKRGGCATIVDGAWHSNVARSRRSRPAQRLLQVAANSTDGFGRHCDTIEFDWLAA